MILMMKSYLVQRAVNLLALWQFKELVIKGTRRKRHGLRTAEQYLYVEQLQRSDTSTKAET